jgi:hypothetical protein
LFGLNLPETQDHIEFFRSYRIFSSHVSHALSISRSVDFILCLINLYQN